MSRERACQKRQRKFRERTLLLHWRHMCWSGSFHSSREGKTPKSRRIVAIRSFRRWRGCFLCWGHRVLSWELWFLDEFLRGTVPVVSEWASDICSGFLGELDYTIVTWDNCSSQSNIDQKWQIYSPVAVWRSLSSSFPWSSLTSE